VERIASGTHLTADAYSLTADAYWRWISRKRRNLSSVVVQLVEELSGVSSVPIRGKGQLDFAIPESLHVLKMDVRRMVETELTPHNSLIEQEG
jgi:hypothetical protein